MVNNSININLTNYHLSPQLNDINKTTTYDVGNPVLQWNRHKNVAELKWHKKIPRYIM